MHRQCQAHKASPGQGSGSLHQPANRPLRMKRQLVAEEKIEKAIGQDFFRVTLIIRNLHVVF
jgi:hypothetical protein